MHIAAIRETDVPYDRNYADDGYRIITAEAQIEHNATSRQTIGGDQS